MCHGVASSSLSKCLVLLLLVLQRSHVHSPPLLVPVPLARACVLCDNRRLRKFICDSLSNLAALSGEELVAQRYERFRALGSFDSLSSEERDAAVSVASGASKPR